MSVRVSNIDAMREELFDLDIEGYKLPAIADQIVFDYNILVLHKLDNWHERNTIMHLARTPWKYKNYK